MLALVILSIGTATAQNTKTYTGFVVDKNGNPVVGAEVMAPGGGATAITDSDGSFKIEVPFMLKKLTASYTGMRDQTLKLGTSPELVFNMKSLKKMTGFINVAFNTGIGLDYVNDVYGAAGIGIIGGQLPQLGKWGWYTKVQFSYIFEDYVNAAITGGALRKLSKKTQLYVGLGGAVTDGCVGGAADLGFIFTVSNHLNVIAGLNFSYCADNYCTLPVNIGVGYTF